jgi:hypothetical protein
VSKQRVRKLRWSDSEPDDPSTPIDWRIAALILATLFLNFPFWFRCNLCMWVPGPIIRSAVLLLAGPLADDRSVLRGAGIGDASGSAAADAHCGRLARIDSNVRVASLLRMFSGVLDGDGDGSARAVAAIGHFPTGVPFV